MLQWKGRKGPRQSCFLQPRFPALSAGCGAEQLGKQAAGRARGISLGLWICLLGMLLIHCSRIPRKQASDSEIKGIVFEVSEIELKS